MFISVDTQDKVQIASVGPVSWGGCKVVKIEDEKWNSFLLENFADGIVNLSEIEYKDGQLVKVV